MRRFILSFDISTTNVGIALWNPDGILLELKHLALKVAKDVESEDRDIVKAEIFKKYVKDYKSELETTYGDSIITNIFVEAPIPNTLVNINTTALLLGFNGMCVYNLYDVFEVIPKRITVHEARKMFCKEFVVHKTVKGLPTSTLSFPKGWKSDEKKLYIQKKVKALEPQIKWLYQKKHPRTLDDTSYDMSDAYVVGIIGLINCGALQEEDWDFRCKDLIVK